MSTPTPPLVLRFDRGTLVLEGGPADLDRSALPGVLPDPRTGQHRAPALAYRAIRDAAARAEIPVALERLGRPARLEAGFDVPALRPYQRDALLAWESAGRRGVVVLPTGAGKTTVAVAALAAAAVPALCVVPTRLLLGQWVEVLRRCFRAPVGCLGDGVRDVRGVTVATYESAYRHMAQLGGRFGLIVVDEAHHFGNGARDEALEMAAAPLRLGLTATPADEPAATRLLELVGPVVYRLGIGDLAGTYLAPFERVTLTLALDAEEKAAHAADQAVFRPAIAAFGAAYPGASFGDFHRHASRSDAGRAALAAWRRLRRRLGYTSAKAEAVARLLAEHRERRVIVFTGDNETAYRVAREHLIMPITCDIGRRERAAAVAAFQDGALRALVSSQVLNEGFDLPAADVGILIASTRGNREYVQRIGRLLRPAPGKRALVIELVTAATAEARRAWQRELDLDAATLVR